MTPTSLESLVRHRAATGEDPASARVWLFHAHAYFDHDVPERVDEARAFRERLREAFASTPHVEVTSFAAHAIGPHPRGSFEVLFTREAFTDVVSWLMFERPTALSVLVHPLTRSQSQDHGERALWLGPPLAIDRSLLEAVDAANVAAGRSEESIIDGTGRH